MMRAFATQSPGDHAHAHGRDSLARKRAPVRREVAVRATPGGQSTLQRSPHCACGGGCPRCQTGPSIQARLAVSQPGDVYEQAAEKVAEQVMRTPDPQSA